MGTDTRTLRDRLEWATNTLAARDQWRRGPGFEAAIRVSDRWWAWAVRAGRVVVTEGDGYRVCAVRGSPRTEGGPPRLAGESSAIGT